MSEKNKNIAFIGLGAMGYAMATNIRKKSPANAVVYIYDVFQSACEKFKSELGHYGPVEIVNSPREAADKSGVIVSIVPGPDEVRQVYLDSSSGVIGASPNIDRLMLECSTIDSATTRSVGEALLAANAGVYVDTPVSGGVPGAEAGMLSFLVGHSKPSAADPISTALGNVISMMGDPHKVFYCEKLGAGLAAKISNNYLSCSILLATAEAMAIGVKSGVDPKLLHDIIHNSTGHSWMADNVQPVPGVVPHAPSTNNYRLGFKTQMMEKDLGLGVQAGKDVSVNPSIAEAAVQVYKNAATDPRCVDRDASSVYLHISDPPA